VSLSEIAMVASLGAGWLLLSNWLRNTNAVLYAGKHCVQKLVPCVSAEVSFCGVKH